MPASVVVEVVDDNSLTVVDDSISSPVKKDEETSFSSAVTVEELFSTGVLTVEEYVTAVVVAVEGVLSTKVVCVEVRGEVLSTKVVSVGEVERVEEFPFKSTVVTVGVSSDPV